MDRVSITQKTLEKFVGRSFEFGKYDCGLMVVSHIKAMGWKIRTGGTWSTAVGLQRFLRRHGGTGAACIDGWGIPRITPAMSIVGDVVELPGEPPFGAFGICLGNGRVLAYHEDVEGAAVIQPTEYVTAWRL